MAVRCSVSLERELETPELELRSLPLVPASFGRFIDAAGGTVVRGARVSKTGAVRCWSRDFWVIGEFPEALEHLRLWMPRIQWHQQGCFLGPAFYVIKLRYQKSGINDPDS